jgi:two-component system, NtrC family, sensor histidine kinase PilS
VNINVTNNGNDINSAVLHHLFSKFTTKSKGGTGLGLYISKNIAEANDGKILYQK